MNTTWHNRDVAVAWNDYMAYQERANPPLANSITTVAGELLENANPAYRNTPMTHVIGIASGGRSAKFLGGALEQVVDQAGRMPRLPSVGVSVNYLSDDQAGQDMAERNIASIKAMQREHPQLPLSYAVVENGPGKPIGDLRDEILGGSAQLHSLRSRIGGIGLTDILLTSMDSDTLSATRWYLPLLQRTHDQAAAAGWIAAPVTRHDRLDSSFQSANALLAWHDLVAMAVRGWTPANFGINLNAYALAKGFHGSAYGEHRELGHHAEDALGSSMELLRLPGQIVTNSAHALVRRMAQEKRMWYGAKHSEPGSPTAETLTHDVPGDYFDCQLHELMPTIIKMARLRREDVLKARGLSEEKAYDASLDYAPRYAQVAAGMIGHLHGTDMIIRSATVQLNRRYSKSI